MGVLSSALEGAKCWALPTDVMGELRNGEEMCVISILTTTMETDITAQSSHTIAISD